MQDASAAHAGIWVYHGPGTEVFPTQGDVVEITGSLMEYNGLTEIDASVEGAVITVTGSGEVPEALIVAESDLSDVAVAEMYESVLITIENVTVASEANSYGEWTTATGLSVDDKFLQEDESYTAPAVGDVYSSITGPLDYTYSAFKVVPRSAADLAQ